MFITEPTELASFRGELIFEYSQEESSDLLFEIELGENQESREVKKLYDVTEAIINIAPIVANQFMTQPSATESALDTPSCGFGLVTLKCGEISSTPKYFVAAKATLPQQGVISTMPHSRLIRYGDIEQVWIRAEQGCSVTVRVDSYNDQRVTSTASFEQSCEECGFLRFILNTRDFEEQSSDLKLHVLCELEEVAQIDYTYTPKSSNSVRLAWIGKMGGIEHYTFPQTLSAKRLKSGGEEYEVESAYEGAKVIEALSEIIDSQRVWMVQGEEYCDVELTSDSVTLCSSGELSTVIYKFERYD